MLFLPPILGIDRVSAERLKEPGAEKVIQVTDVAGQTGALLMS